MTTAGSTPAAACCGGLRGCFWASPVFGCALLPSSGLRVALLRLFGARVGEGVVIHSGVQVKYPWHLVTGDHCWIGERAWIDNLTTTRLGSNVCISQGAYLCTGNHDWKDPAFGLLIATISLEDGAWVGAQSTMLPGSRLEAGAVLGAGGVLSGVVPEWQVFTGNPAVFARSRVLREANTLRPRVETETNR